MLSLLSEATRYVVRDPATGRRPRNPVSSFPPIRSISHSCAYACATPDVEPAPPAKLLGLTAELETVLMTILPSQLLDLSGASYLSDLNALIFFDVHNQLHQTTCPNPISKLVYFGLTPMKAAPVLHAA